MNALKPRPFRPVLWLSGLLAILCFSSVAAEDSDVIVHVEEDWEIVMATPDADWSTPQFGIVMSPAGLAGDYMVFEMNHSTSPSPVDGGLQIQRWSGDHVVEWDNCPQSEKLHHADEKITFTTNMTVAECGLTFEVSNGHSESWGEFGDHGHLKLVAPSYLSNLNGYSPDFSASESRVDYGSNRVQTLKLVEVRYYDSEGLVSTDETDRVVHDNPDQ